jgi:hypothetical protein
MTHLTGSMLHPLEEFALFQNHEPLDQSPKTRLRRIHPKSGAGIPKAKRDEPRGPAPAPMVSLAQVDFGRESAFFSPHIATSLYSPE